MKSGLIQIPFPKIINGTDSADTIHGSSGMDFIYGNAGDDFLYGGAGNDSLEGGHGRDFLDGGEGIDTVSYFSAGGGVIVDLAQGSGRGAAGPDTLMNIENISGSNYRDRLEGDNQQNTIWGHAGDDELDGAGGVDTLMGGAGNDLLIGGSGADFLDGGAGIDTLDYGDSASGVIVELAGDGLVGGGVQGDAAGDRLLNIENIIGSDFDDLLIGNAADNVLEGGDGADTLFGGAGRDHFVLQRFDASDRLMDFQSGADKIVIDGLRASEAFGDDGLLATGVISTLTSESGRAGSEMVATVSFWQQRNLDWSDELFYDTKTNTLYEVGEVRSDNLFATTFTVTELAKIGSGGSYDTSTDPVTTDFAFI